MPFQADSGLWVVKRGEAQWLAWREWMALAFDWGYWPNNATVLLEWPPETPEAAAAVADHIRSAREAVSKEAKRGERIGPARQVPIQPPPWRKWTPQQCAQAVAKFAAENDEGTLSTEEASAMMQRVYHRLGMPRGFRAKFERKGAGAVGEEPEVISPITQADVERTAQNAPALLEALSRRLKQSET